MIKRSILVLHRWLGVALCLFFLIWFPSGIGMMYWDFPSVSPADRLARSPALDPAKVVLSPAQVSARLGGPPAVQVRLNTFDGRPVYRLRDARRETIVYADTGEEQVHVSSEMMQRIAAGWTGQPASAAKVELMADVDQWTVQGELRRLRPLWKYSFPNGEQLYISGTSGEVVQCTTTASRMGAYLGPIPHWLYFTPLRRHQAQWSAFVIWTSGIGAITAILGVIIGISMYSPSKRFRYGGEPTGIPYRGPKRLHMILGLIFGFAAATWAFSGMLSMDPFPARSGGRAGGGRRGGGARIPEALRGTVEMAAFAARHPREALARMPNLAVKELELTSFAGEPVYMATADRGETRIIPVDAAPLREFDRHRIIDVVTKAAAPDGVVEIRLLSQYDLYYLDRRRQRPLPVILARLNDAEQTRFYIDPATARVVGTYSSRNRAARWLYHGLHSLDFPWLYNYRPLWDIVVITFMVGGTALGVTALILAWGVLGRTLRDAFTWGATSRLRPSAKPSSGGEAR